MKTIRLGFSSCPNDTFMFHGLVSGDIPLVDMTLVPVIEDIEALNLRARDCERSLEISKLSVAAWIGLQRSYVPLNVGAALGRGCGPLVVGRDGNYDRLEQLDHKKVAIPGHYTTAHLLLRIFAECKIRPVVMRFDQIMPAVAGGLVDAGVIIHESRFTYHDHGLKIIADLGELWEQATNLPLPLGIIAASIAVEPRLRDQFANGLTRSIQQAMVSPERSRAWIHDHAQEIDSEVCRRHIELYVNDFSMDLGDEGRRSIAQLAKMADGVGFDHEES